MTPEEFEKAQFLEKDLEEFLERHLDKIEPGLKKIGRQYSTPVGPIDLYARAANGGTGNRLFSRRWGPLCHPRGRYRQAPRGYT
jgi:hypothetical protein